jgi:hypothetical protein
MGLKHGDYRKLQSPVQHEHWGRVTTTDMYINRPKFAKVGKHQSTIDIVAIQ